MELGLLTDRGRSLSSMRKNALWETREGNTLSRKFREGDVVPARRKDRPTAERRERILRWWVTKKKKKKKVLGVGRRSEGKPTRPTKGIYFRTHKGGLMG